jgi:translation initiation factor IF-2
VRSRSSAPTRCGPRPPSGVGAITESDVTLAQASGAVIIGFNVRAHKEAREAAERAGIEIRYYNIIYDLVDDVKARCRACWRRRCARPCSATRDPRSLQHLEGRQDRRLPRHRRHVERGANVRLIRDNVVVHEGKLGQLKRFKDDVKEVVAGQECGMAFENYQDMRVGDVIECYRVGDQARSL